MYKSNEEIVEKIDRIWIKNPNKLKDIKDYIINIRLQDIQSIKEMVEGIKRNPHNEPRESVAEIYNQALEDIKVKLDELINK